MPSWTKCLLSAALVAVTSATAHPAQLPFVPMRSEFATGLGPTLYDSLAQDTRATIFFDYARDSASVAPLLASSGHQTTLFVPTNSAIIALGRKPHLGAPPVGPNGEITTYASSREEEDARKAYLERWVRRHVVADKVEGEGEWETMDGEVVSMRAEGDSWKVGPGDLDVKDVVQTRNGALVFIDGTLGLDDE